MGELRSWYKKRHATPPPPPPPPPLGWQVLVRILNIFKFSKALPAICEICLNVYNFIRHIATAATSLQHSLNVASFKLAAHHRETWDNLTGPLYNNVRLLKVISRLYRGKIFRAVPDKKNLGVFEGKTLYFCGGGGDWLSFNPVVGCLMLKCNSVGGCPSQKCSSVGTLHSNGIFWVVEV